MEPERKIIVAIATSADGYIARKDGGIDWLDRPRPKGFYGMDAFMKSIDTIIWGRTTWDMAAGMGGAGGYGARIRNYVFTHRPAAEAAGVEFVNEPVAPFVERLRARPGKNIWMMGGGGVIASFLDAGAIDEFSISVVPTLIGEGIPLVQPARRNVALELISSQAFPDGVVQLHYRVAPPKPPKRRRKP